MSKIISILWITLILLLGGACAPMMKQPLKTSGARLGERSSIYEDLKRLPGPDQPIVVAVYKFRDQTGQYKPTENGSSWSTAVTQGATSILIESLEESGWFVPIEREGLGNLLNERKIIRSSRANYGSGEQNPDKLLPPLLYAGMILEGGIVSYESNVLTGGTGVRYFGTGASTQYREDRVSIYLRAISTSNGKILKTVHTTKTILSQQMDAGVFRYVSLQHLLEAEIGFTYNEPSGIAVQEAIDKAVYALVMEGISEKLWNTADQNGQQSPMVQEYILEKERSDRTDHLGLESLTLRKPFSLGINLGSVGYSGDYPQSIPGPSAEFLTGFRQNKNLSFELSLGAGKVAAKNAFNSTIQYLGLDARYRFYNSYKFTPFIQAGAGYLLNTGNSPLDYQLHFRENGQAYLGTVLGYEYMATPRTGLSIAGGYNWILSDQIDGFTHGKYKDRFWKIDLGIRFYF